MKVLPFRTQLQSVTKYVFLETCRAPESTPEVSPDQISARGRILELLVDEIIRSRPTYFEQDEFVETDDPDTRGVFIQNGASDRLQDAMARDAARPNRAARVKQSGEIVLDQSIGFGKYTDDIVILGDLSPELQRQAGLAAKTDLVEWLRSELGYATEVANARLGAEDERQEITPGSSWSNILFRGPAVRFAEAQTSVLRAQANMMSLPGELDALERNNPTKVFSEDDTERISEKLGQIAEAGFDCSAYRARFERLQGKGQWSRRCPIINTRSRFCGTPKFLLLASAKKQPFSALFARHRFAQVDFHIALQEWVKQRGDAEVLLELQDFICEPKVGRAKPKPSTELAVPELVNTVIPDGTFAVGLNSGPVAVYLVEIHRSTQSKAVTDQLAKYFAVIKSEIIAQKYDYKANPIICSVHHQPSVLASVKARLNAHPGFEPFKRNYVFHALNDMNTNFVGGLVGEGRRPSNTGSSL